MAGHGGPRPNSGRKPGPTKATLERAAIAERVINEAAMSGQKLAKEVLNEFMILFGGLATKFQPASSDTAVVHDWAKTPAFDKFVQFATLARDTAKDLAKYQSPTFKAIEVHAPAPTVEGNDGRKITKFTLHIFGDDPRMKTIEGKKGLKVG
jgi:hypothetical protein